VNLNAAQMPGQLAELMFNGYSSVTLKFISGTGLPFARTASRPSRDTRPCDHVSHPQRSTTANTVRKRVDFGLGPRLVGPPRAIAAALDYAFAARYSHQFFQDSEAQEPHDKVRPEMAQARDAAGRLPAAIEAGDSDTAKSGYKVLKSSCFNCHREYRANTRK
jgi:hypothetical protein